MRFGSGDMLRIGRLAVVLSVFSAVASAQEDPLAWFPAREGVASFLPAQYANVIHIFSNHFGSGGWEDVWFQKGVGVVGEHYIHNGTYDEYSKKLLSFM